MQSYKVDSEQRMLSVNLALSKLSKTLSSLEPRIVIPFIVLLCCAVVGWIITESYMAEEETSQWEQHFQSTTDQQYNLAFSSFFAIQSSARELAAVIGEHCSRSAMWPYCVMDPHDTFKFVTNPILEFSGDRSLQFSAILPANATAVREYEAWAKNFTDNDPDYPEGVATWEFGYGISVVENGQRVHDTTGWGQGENDIIVPILQVNPVETNLGAVLLNAYYSTLRAATFDRVIACVNNHTDPGLRRQCLGVTETIQLVQDPSYRPASIMYAPIFPFYNPEHLVGFSAVVFNWDVLLQKSQGKKDIGNLDIVLYTDTTVSTFTLRNGEISVKGDGDMHDKDFERFGRKFLLNDFDAQHTIYYYPTRDYYALFQTYGPMYSGFAAFCIIMMLNIVLTVFQYHLAKSSKDKIRRQFVRFVSHEVRSPLNTVSLGLMMLKNEFEEIEFGEEGDSSDSERLLAAAATTSSFTDMKKNEYSAEQQLKTERLARLLRNRVTEWSSIVMDSSNAAETAVTVLNDLINYDKIELGMMQLEFELVPIVPVVREEIARFYSPARRQGVKLLLNIVIDRETSSSIRRLSHYSSSSANANGNANASANASAVAGGGGGVSCATSSSAVSYAQSAQLLLSTSPSKTIAKLGRSASFLGNAKSSDGLFAVVDTSKVSLIIRNLVSNALKFTPTDGQVLITVDWLTEEQVFFRPSIDSLHSRSQLTKFNVVPNGMLIISVTDSGAGISKENQQLLFQEGRQFNAQKLQSGNGSGLGLWICKQLVERLGGRLTAHSDGVGTGSTFMVELPVVRSQRDESAAISISSNDGDSLLKRNKSFFSSCFSKENEIHPMHTIPPLDRASHVDTSNNNSSSTKNNTTHNNNNNENVSLHISPSKLSSLSESVAAHEIPQLIDNGTTETRNSKESSRNMTERHSAAYHRNSISVTSGRSLLIVNAWTEQQEEEFIVHSDRYSLNNARRRVKNILVVDDAPSNRKMLIRVLIRLNSEYICDEAEDGLECVRMVSERQRKIDHSMNAAHNDEHAATAATAAASGASVSLNKSDSSEKKELLPMENDEDNSNNSNNNIGNSSNSNITTQQQQQQYDLIFMDSEMPNMNGPAAVKKLHELGFKYIPVIGVTGNVMKEDWKHYLSCGATDVLAKPVSVPKLQECIRKVEDSWLIEDSV